MKRLTRGMEMSWRRMESETREKSRIREEGEMKERRAVLIPDRTVTTSSCSPRTVVQEYNTCWLEDRYLGLACPYRNGQQRQVKEEVEDRLVSNAR